MLLRAIITFLVVAVPHVSHATAYSQYNLIRNEVLKQQRVCTYENARGELHVITKPKAKQCAKYINTDRLKT
ncbi:hypothetical protein B224_0073 [Aeromonas media WS]|nr:hypothetical protein B224_0073 [Aeromonas media WS]